MSKDKNALAELFAACWEDEALEARLLSDPKSLLAEYDMPVPDDMVVKVVGNAGDCVHVNLPASAGGHMDLSDDELIDDTYPSVDNAAGGFLHGPQGAALWWRCGLSMVILFYRTAADLMTGPGVLERHVHITNVVESD